MRESPIMPGHLLNVLPLVVLILVPACSTTTVNPAGRAFRVMTYNIRLDLASDGADAWPHRRGDVASMIRFHRADLVGLQEALPDQLDDLESLLPEFGRFGQGREEDLGGEHCAILYRKQRFDLLESDTFWLSETPAIPGNRGWDAAYPRIVTWGRLRDRQTGLTFYHFNTHFDSVGERARRESAALLVSEIREIAGEDALIILSGDFNATPESEPYRTIVAAGFRDAITLSREPHHGPTSTWNGLRQIEPHRRIDFIFVKGPFDVVRHGILSDRFDRGFPSDHLAVIAEIVTAGE